MLMMASLTGTGCMSKALVPAPMKYVERGTYGGAAESTSSALLTVTLRYEGVPDVKAKLFVDGMEWGETRTHGGRDGVEYSSSCAFLGRRRLQVRFYEPGVTAGSSKIEYQGPGWTPWGRVFETEIDLQAGRETVLDLVVSPARVAVMNLQLRQPSGGLVAGTTAAPRSALRLDSPVDTPGRPGRRSPNAWALVVGVENYRDVQPARYAVNDAIAFSRYATATLGISEERVRVLLDERATRTDIDVALSEWLPNNVGEGDTVFVFWSGHGAPGITDSRGYLVPYDGNPAYLDRSAWAVTDVVAALEHLEAARVVVLLDACFTGTGERSVILADARPLVARAAILGPKQDGVVLLAAAASDQMALGRAPDHHGLFTYHVLDGLKDFRADLDSDGVVSLEELASHVSGQVEAEAARRGHTQQPSLLGDTAARSTTVAGSAR